MLYGYEEPRVYTPPLRELTPETSLGFLFIEFVENQVRGTLLPWDKWLAIHMLEIIGDFGGWWRFCGRPAMSRAISILPSLPSVPSWRPIWTK